MAEFEEEVTVDGGNPKLKGLFNALKGDSVFNEWSGNDYDAFVRTYSDKKNMEGLYNALKGDSVFKEWVGDDLESTLKVYAPNSLKKKSEVISEPLGSGGKDGVVSTLPSESVGDEQNLLNNQQIGNQLQVDKNPEPSLLDKTFQPTVPSAPSEDFKTKGKEFLKTYSHLALTGNIDAANAEMANFVGSLSGNDREVAQGIIEQYKKEVAPDIEKIKELKELYNQLVLISESKKKLASDDIVGINKKSQQEEAIKAKLNDLSVDRDLRNQGLTYGDAVVAKTLPFAVAYVQASGNRLLEGAANVLKGTDMLLSNKNPYIKAAVTAIAPFASVAYDLKPRDKNIKETDNPLYLMGELLESYRKDHSHVNPLVRDKFSYQLATAITGDLPLYAAATMLGGGAGASYLGAMENGIGEYESAKEKTKNANELTFEQFRQKYESEEMNLSDVETVYNSLQGQSPEEVGGKMFLAAGAVGTLEGLPMVSWLNKLDKRTGGIVTKYLEKKGISAFTNAVLENGVVSPFVQGIEEASQEAFSQALTNVTANKVYDLTRSYTEGIFDAGSVGFGMGFLLSALGNGVKALTQKRDESKSPEEKKEWQKSINLLMESKSRIENEGKSQLDNKYIAELESKRQTIASKMVSKDSKSDATIDALSNAMEKVENDISINKQKELDKIQLEGAISYAKEQAEAVKDIDENLHKEYLNEVAKMETELAKLNESAPVLDEEKADKLQAEIDAIFEKPQVEEIVAPKVEVVKVEESPKVESLDKDVQEYLDTANYNKRREDNVLVRLPIDLVINNQQKDFKVERGNENEIKGRIDKAKKYIQNRNNNLEASDIYIPPSGKNEGKIGFSDGRHRIVAAKELGANHVMVEMPRTIEQFDQLYRLLSDYGNKEGIEYSELTSIYKDYNLIQTSDNTFLLKKGSDLYEFKLNESGGVEGGQLLKNGKKVKNISDIEFAVQEHLEENNPSANQRNINRYVGRDISKPIPKIDELSKKEQKKQINTKQNDKENESRVSGEVGKRQEPVEAKPIEEGSTKAAETSGSIQGNEKEVAELPKDEFDAISKDIADIEQKIATIKVENPNEFKKDGSLKKGSKITASLKALNDMLSKKREKIAPLMESEFAERAKKENEKSRIETEKLNKEFEERQKELAKSNTPEQIESDKNEDEINRIFDKVSNNEKPTKREIDFVNENAWLPKGFKFSENGLEKEPTPPTSAKPEPTSEEAKVEVEKVAEKTAEKPKSESEQIKERISERKNKIESLKNQRNNLGIRDNRGKIDGYIMAEYVLLAKDYLELGITNIKELITELIKADDTLSTKDANLIALSATEDLNKVLAQEKSPSSEERYTNAKNKLVEMGYDAEVIDAALFAERNFDSIIAKLQEQGLVDKVC